MLNEYRSRKSGRMYGMKMKSISIVIAVILIASAFGGCTKKDDKTAATTGNASSTASKTTAKTNASSTANTSGTASAAASATAGTNQGGGSVSQETGNGEVTEAGTGDFVLPDVITEGGDNGPIKIVDLKGRNIKVKIFDEKPASGQKPSPNSGSQFLELYYQAMLKAEQLFNCKFVFEMVPYASIGTEFEAASLAGVSYADAVRFTRGSALPKWEKMNIILPLNNYVNFSNTYWDIYQNIYGVLNPENIYAYNMVADVKWPYGVLYHRDVLDRDGVPDLHDYAEKGQWNWDTFLEVASKLTHDFNGDGIIDQYGLSVDTQTNAGLCFMYSNGVPKILYNNNNDAYEYGLSHPEGLRALQFLSDVYNTYKVLAIDAGYKMFLARQSAMAFDFLWRNVLYKPQGYNQIGSEILPSGPDNPNDTLVFEPGGAHSFFYPATIPEQDRVGVLNAMAYLHAFITAKESTGDGTLSYNDYLMSSAVSGCNTQRDIDAFFRVNNSKLNYEYAITFSGTNTQYYSVFTQAFKTSGSIASTAASIESKIQDIIKTTLSK